MGKSACHVSQKTGFDPQKLDKKPDAMHTFTITAPDCEMVAETGEPISLEHASQQLHEARPYL